MYVWDTSQRRWNLVGVGMGGSAINTTFQKVKVVCHYLEDSSSGRVHCWGCKLKWDTPVKEVLMMRSTSQKHGHSHCLVHKQSLLHEQDGESKKDASETLPHTHSRVSHATEKIRLISPLVTLLLLMSWVPNENHFPALHWFLTAWLFHFTIMGLVRRFRGLHERTSLWVIKLRTCNLATRQDTWPPFAAL